MDSKKVKIKIDWDGHNYAACPENDDIACIVTGKSFEKLQIEMLSALREHIEWMKEDGDIIPDEFMG